jgi:ferredoxin
MSKESTRTLHLDPIACDGRGLCHYAAPGLIDLDEWGYPLLRDGGLRLDVTDAELPQARAAVEACPTLALHLGR